MMSYDFSTTVYGKWILAGEHAVLRGCPAIVFPVKNKALQLSFIDNHEDLRAEHSGEFGQDVHLLFMSVIERGLEIVNHSISELSGRFIVDNEIPVGAGLGVSGALCTALGRWFIWKELIKEQDLYNFARELENMFHGESSGVDIAAAIACKGIIFHHSGEWQTLEQNWQPHWYLSYSDQIGITSHCVKKVKELWQRDPELAARIDKEMEYSVQTAIKALNKDQDTGLPILASAINQAKICFTQWGLAGGKVEQHITGLLGAGALAAKPTGSGDGGFVLSLWAHKAPESIASQMIAV